MDVGRTGRFKKLGADPWARLEREQQRAARPEGSEVTLDETGAEDLGGLGGALLKGTGPTDDEAAPDEIPGHDLDVWRLEGAWRGD